VIAGPSHEAGAGHWDGDRPSDDRTSPTTIAAFAFDTRGV
jgi:hypothetical protein